MYFRIIYNQIICFYLLNPQKNIFSFKVFTKVWISLSLYRNLIVNLYMGYHVQEPCFLQDNENHHISSCKSQILQLHFLLVIAFVFILWMNSLISDTTSNLFSTQSAIKPGKIRTLLPLNAEWNVGTYNSANTNLNKINMESARKYKILSKGFIIN